MKIVCSVIVAVFCFFAAYAAEATHTHDSGSDQKSEEKKARFTKHFNETLFQISGKGEFSVEILLDDKEYKKLGGNVIGIVVHNKHDEDVEGADLKLVLIDDQGKDITGSPVVKEKGDGLYTVASFEILKEGKGQFKVTIRKKNVEDTAVFDLPAAMKERFPAGKYTE